jgi:hypothetical protein
MTAISAPRTSAGITPFERSLLRTAAVLDGFVVRRLDRRASVEYRRAAQVQSAMVLSRDAAQAGGAIGLLPR